MTPPLQASRFIDLTAPDDSTDPPTNAVHLVSDSDSDSDSDTDSDSEDVIFIASTRADREVPPRPMPPSRSHGRVTRDVRPQVSVVNSQQIDRQVPPSRYVHPSSSDTRAMHVDRSHRPQGTSTSSAYHAVLPTTRHVFRSRSRVDPRVRDDVIVNRPRPRPLMWSAASHSTTPSSMPTTSTSTSTTTTTQESKRLRDFGETLQRQMMVHGDRALTFETLSRLDDFVDPVQSGRALSSTGLRTLGGDIVATTAHRTQSCCICLVSLNVGDHLRVLPCSHAFHRSCIDKWLAVNACCPVDMERLPDPDLRRRPRPNSSIVIS